MNWLHKLTADEYTNKPLFTHLEELTSDIGYHKHSFIEFFYVIEGECKHKINGKTERLAIGDAYLLFIGDRHSFHKDISNSFLHRDIIIDEDYFKSACDSLSPNLYEKLKEEKYPKKHKLSQEQILDLENNVSCLSANPDVFEVFSKILIVKIVNFSLMHYHNISQPVLPWIKQIIDRLSAPYNFKIPIADLLKPYAFNRSYMCREFKKATGLSIVNYFNRERLQYARMLIKQSTIPIVQICGTVGFNNMTHFYRSYGKLFSESPAASRKSEKI